MRQLQIIPEFDNIEQSMQLAEKYQCAFEFNDFFLPEVLEDKNKQEKIINYYAKMHPDFSKDTIHGAFLDITVHSMDPLIREVSKRRVFQSMEVAERMCVSGVVFHTGRLANFREPAYLKNWLETNEKFFYQLADQFPNQQIYMENMFDEAPDVMTELAIRMQEVSNFSICLDYAHAVLQKNLKEEWFQQLAPYIRHMHINDNDFINDLHQPLGEGRIDWKEFNIWMKKYQIESSVLIEVRGISNQKKSLEYLKHHQIYPMG